MDTIVKFTISLFIFSIFLLFFKITKKVSLNYQNINNKNIDNNKKQDINEIDTSQIKWKINN
ncbi:uncharacterized protein METZ01_LOCUS293205 [marine metagenome]|jgi:hypothetical protein|uniref:Uncharacterized protein n=1 Tax=marine metagenome TaxID=408172 RepID=A0A382LZP3_9ZZZZ|tara:strand:- start:124 stop:309 length:186 start_codon:yes stop_codon:yes gene_type:complete